MWHDHDISSKPYHVAVVIGRFQPVHNGHVALLKEASRIAHTVLVLVGSSNIARDSKNPFTFAERMVMIQENFPQDHIPKKSSSEDKANIIIRPVVDDLYNLQRWISDVQSEVKNAVDSMGWDPKKVVLVGHQKDNSTTYLKMFPSFAYNEVPNCDSLNATEVREAFYMNALPMGGLPEKTREFLFDFAALKPEIYKNLCDEFKFFKEYKKDFQHLKYPPYFVTVDAVVLNRGHILLVRRRSHPGKGLWALPGGFLNHNERIEDGILRELDEETLIKVDKETLRACNKGIHTFDHPDRSLRGRTITHCGLFVLNNLETPDVTGNDDADKARWVPLHEFFQMGDQMFEDHFSICTYMIGRS